MRNIKLTLAYDGTDFAGWQSQAQGERTVQDTLKDAVARLTSETPDIIGSGRTDSGVHALAQVASFETASAHPPEVIMRALNAMLPPDLRVLGVEEAPEDFHPQRNALKKRYAYLICNAEVVSPFALRYSWGVHHALDLGAMREAAARLAGRHDFRAFMAAGSSVKTTERELYSLEVSASDAVSFMGFELRQPGGRFIRIEAEGGGFLRHMVRNIAGTLVEVGKGAMRPSDMDGVLASLDRSKAGPTAPAQGLFMVSVSY